MSEFNISNLSYKELASDLSQAIDKLAYKVLYIKALHKVYITQHEHTDIINKLTALQEVVHRIREKSKEKE